MKKCKYCKSEIDKKAKVCPHCQKKQTNAFLRGVMIFLGIVIVLGGVGALANDATSNSAKDEKDSGCYITIDKFNQIQNGMSYNQVAEIIGCDGTLSTESAVGDTNMRIYSWKAKNGIANATFNFTNDELNAKAQIGLE